MSDSAFKSAPFAGYTSEQLKAAANAFPPPMTAPKMLAEVARREKVAAGDTSVMTAGERLRHAQKGST